MTMRTIQGLTRVLRQAMFVATIAAIGLLGVTGDGDHANASDGLDRSCPEMLKKIIRDHNLRPTRKAYDKAYSLCRRFEFAKAKEVLLKSPRAKGTREPRVVDHRKRADREQVRACMNEGKALARKIHLPLKRATVGKINRYCLRGDRRGALTFVRNEGLRSCMRSIREYVRRGGVPVDRRTWKDVERHCRSGNDERAIAAVNKATG